MITNFIYFLLKMLELSNKQTLKNRIIFVDLFMNLDNRQLKSKKHVSQKVVKK